MDFAQTIQEFFNSHVPEVILLIGGIIALLMIYTYIKDEKSKKYMALMVLGVIFGVLMIMMAASGYARWHMFTSLVIVIMGFTMIVRPFRKVEFAVIIGLIVIILTYILLGNLESVQFISVLASGWPRVIVAFVVGAIAYMIANFAEKLVMLFGKLFNWWPFLAVLALLCIAEAVCLLVFNHSLYFFL